MPGTSIAGCEKTAAYAAGRGLPTPEEVFAAGEALSYNYSYDKAGNVPPARIEVTLATPVVPLGAVTTLELDALGRTTAVTDAAGAVWASAYDALSNLTTATDPLGAVTQYAYDLMGRPTTVTDPSGAVSTATYDAVGRLAGVTDAQPRLNPGDELYVLIAD